MKLAYALAQACKKDGHKLQAKGLLAPYRPPKYSQQKKEWVPGWDFGYGSTGKLKI